MIIEICFTLALSRFENFEPSPSQCLDEICYPIDPNPPKFQPPQNCVVNGNELDCYPIDESGKF